MQKPVTLHMIDGTEADYDIDVPLHPYDTLNIPWCPPLGQARTFWVYRVFRCSEDGSYHESHTRLPHGYFPEDEEELRRILAQ